MGGARERQRERERPMEKRRQRKTAPKCRSADFEGIEGAILKDSENRRPPRTVRHWYMGGLVFLSENNQFPFKNKAPPASSKPSNPEPPPPLKILNPNAPPLDVPVGGRRWSSNPSGKCSYERPTRGTVCGTMRSMCGADAGCLAINYQSL